MNLSVITDQDGNTKMYSGPSNLSPASDAYKELVDARVEKIREANSDADTDKIPEDLVTCSGSGLDPDVSLAAAKYQIPRIAEVRGMSEEEVEAIIDECTTHKALGIFGEEKQAIIEATTQNPELILLDLGLPDMDGVDVIKKI